MARLRRSARKKEKSLSRGFLFHQRSLSSVPDADQAVNGSLFAEEENSEGPPLNGLVTCAVDPCGASFLLLFP